MQRNNHVTTSFITVNFDIVVNVYQPRSVFNCKRLITSHSKNKLKPNRTVVEPKGKIAGELQVFAVIRI